MHALKDQTSPSTKSEQINGADINVCVVTDVLYKHNLWQSVRLGFGSYPRAPISFCSIAHRPGRKRSSAGQLRSTEPRFSFWDQHQHRPLTWNPFPWQRCSTTVRGREKTDRPRSPRLRTADRPWWRPSRRTVDCDTATRRLELAFWSGDRRTGNRPPLPVSCWTGTLWTSPDGMSSTYTDFRHLIFFYGSRKTVRSHVIMLPTCNTQRARQAKTSCIIHVSYSRIFAVHVVPRTWEKSVHFRENK